MYILTVRSLVMMSFLLKIIDDDNGSRYKQYDHELVMDKELGYMESLFFFSNLLNRSGNLKVWST